MSDPASFASRRPNTSNLPDFHLPPPPLSSLHTKFSAPLYTNVQTTQPTPATTLTSVGNLLTPPSNGSADGISPSAGTHNEPMQTHSFTPSTTTWSAPPLTTFGTAGGYGYQPAASTYSRSSNIFSPSLNTLVRANTSPNTSESLPPPPYELPHHYNSSMSMSAPNLPAMLPMQQQQQQHHHMMSNGSMSASAPQSAVTQPSPVHPQDAFARPPPTPTYYHGSQPSATPQQSTFPYSGGPSPVLQSPLSSNGPMPRISPVNASMPSMQSQSPAYATSRSYPPPYQSMGPVLTNVGNPHGQLALVNGMPNNAYNSGHAAMQQMYHHAAPMSQQNDRPFRCDQCPQSFNRNHDLKRHKRIHLAVKPFPCGHCDKSFSRKDALKRHVLVKGCGKASATAEIKELDGSDSPEPKSEKSISPVMMASS
ncbi:hypothetical protein B0A48_11877 [Cryoendolithus antarcticus]|uniref:C2H2-type domain-containing protein n=2 Tax=Cryoendolithus antarcticus TaxID=1507870 RepID=A0A1V8ST29_9PEZI|nr:hypothetical protein B0A48_11877 [Cryoendolithus antarcticus]